MSGVRHETPAAAPAPRPNVMAFASPTTTRFVVLLAALVSGGLFLGTWLHNESSAGTAWTHRVAACTNSEATLGAPGSLSQVPEFRQCTAGVERKRAAYALGGAATALLVGIGVMCAAPYVIERRRRLRRAGPKLAPALQRLATLAEAANVRAPLLVVGPSTLRDGFSYGLPGQYRIALPPAIAVRARDSATFDPLVRHELAHVARHDVAFAWLARSIWIVIVPLLALPVVWSLLTGDFSLLPSYAWRAALLAAVTFLAANALLRTREHEADLRAACDDESSAQLRGLLGRVPTRQRSRWRGAFAYHPSGAQRLAVIEQPGRLAVVSFADGLTTAFLAALILPLFIALMSIPSADLAFVVPAATVGPLLGATIGLGLWRQAIARRVTGREAPVAPAVLGVFAGSVLGEAASLAQTGGTLTASNRAPSLLLTALAVAGATAVAAGLGELFADASTRLRTAKAAWIACVVLVGALFAAAIWAGTTLSLGLDEVGWAVVGSTLITILTTRPAAGVALALAAAATWAMLAARRGAAPPQWAVAAGGPEPVPAPSVVRVRGAVAVGVAAGMAAALVLVGFRLVAGPAQGFAEQELRFYAYVWLFASAGVAAAVVLAMRMRTRGLGVALLASPVASVVAAVGFVAFNAALGGNLAPPFLDAVFRSGLALGLLLLLAVAVVALLPVPRPRPPIRTLAAVSAAAALAGALSFGVVVGRNVLVPLAALDRYVASQQQPTQGGETGTGGQSGEALLYTAMYVQHATRVMDAVESSVVAIDRATLTGEQRAERIRLECLTPVQALLDGAKTVQPKTTEVQVVHQQLLTALQHAAQAFNDFAAAYETNDSATFQRARIERTQAQQLWQAWQQAVAQLTAGKTPAPRNEHGRRTCQLFAQMVNGVDALSAAQQQELLAEMAVSVAQSGEPQLMQAVTDLGQGALAGQTQRFATGMRTLSALCGVPYR